MGSLKQEYQLSLYEVESVISNNTSEVAIVKHSMTGKTYIRKRLRDSNSYHVHRQINEKPHRNVAEIEAVITLDGEIYVIQEYIQGLNIWQILEKEKQLDKNRAVAIMDQICDGLIHLHGLLPPVIHRDIKPSNVMVEVDGTVKLIDFDVARNYKADTVKDTQYLGTEGYASPEQFGFKQTDIRSDIYSAGILFCEMMTGQTVISRKVLDKDIFAIISKCVKLDPQERYQSAAELKKALHQLNKRKRLCIYVAMGIFAIAAGVVMTTKNLNEARNVIEESHNAELQPAIITDTKKVIDETIAAIVDTTIDSQISGTESFDIDLKAFYEQDSYVYDLLKNKIIQRKLTDLLGNEYDYVMKSLAMLDCFFYDDELEAYYIAGGSPDLYTVMEVCIIIYQDGEIACGFLKDSTVHYYSSNDVLYEKPAILMLEWLSAYQGNTIQFQRGQQFVQSADISGTYVCKEKSAYIKIRESQDGTYWIDGNAVWGTNAGTIEGEISETGKQQYLYIENDGESGRAELAVTIYRDCLVANTLQGSFGGMNVTFDGVYEKQENDIRQSVPIPVPESSVGISESQIEISAETDPGVAGAYIPQVYTLEDPEGEVLSLVGTPEGNYYTASKHVGDMIITSSEGKEVVVEPEDGLDYYYSMLVYNHYKDEIYLLCTPGQSILDIFRMDKDMNLELVLKTSCNNMEKGCSFFSDGVMICGMSDNSLIDTNTWQVMGRIPSGRSLHVINDKIYSVSGSEFIKLNFQGETEEIYPSDASGAYADSWPGWRLFSDGQKIYFAKNDGIYQFDGENMELFLEMKNFRYFTRMNYNFLSMTNIGFRYYDYAEKHIKEVRKKT